MYFLSSRLDGQINRTGAMNVFTLHPICVEEGGCEECLMGNGKETLL